MGNIQQLKALAKINLGLDVLGRRENGYHDVRMVMQTIYLYDNITIQRTETPGITLESNLYFLPNDEGNIAYKAAKMLMDEFEIRDGVHITLDKHIPVAAGLAGGSSNAAAVLVGMNRMFSLGLSEMDLMERGVKLGQMFRTVLCAERCLQKDRRRTHTTFTAAKVLYFDRKAWNQCVNPHGL